MRSQEVIDLLKKDGWLLDRVRGSHHIFKHPLKKGHVTVPHPRKEMVVATLRSIEKQCGLKLR